jgi:hypothetical protein
MMKVGGKLPPISPARRITKPATNGEQAHHKEPPQLRERSDGDQWNGDCDGSV